MVIERAPGTTGLPTTAASATSKRILAGRTGAKLLTHRRQHLRNLSPGSSNHQPVSLRWHRSWPRSCLGSRHRGNNSKTLGTRSRENKNYQEEKAQRRRGDKARAPPARHQVRSSGNIPQSTKPCCQHETQNTGMPVCFLAVTPDSGGVRNRSHAIRKEPQIAYFESILGHI